ncbi:MAG: hypothetical protein ACI9BW_002347 [Gammaproteobacteria bacterium]
MLSPGIIRLSNPRLWSMITRTDSNNLGIDS